MAAPLLLHAATTSTAPSGSYRLIAAWPAPSSRPASSVTAVNTSPGGAARATSTATRRSAACSSAIWCSRGRPGEPAVTSSTPPPPSRSPAPVFVDIPSRPAARVKLRCRSLWVLGACPRQSGFPMTSAKWRAGSRGRIDPGRLDLGRVVLRLDRPERGAGLAGAQPPSGVLGEQTLDDRAQRAGAQERGRPVDKYSGEGGEQRAPVEGRPALDRGEQCRAEREQVAGRPESPPSSRSGETYAGVPGNVPAAGEASSMAHAMPKSVRTTRPPPHRCTLPGVTSRCTIPARCVAWSTSTRRRPTLVTWRTGSGPASFSACCRVRPGSGSITIHGQPFSWTMS